MCEDRKESAGTQRWFQRTQREMWAHKVVLRNTEEPAGLTTEDL